MSTDYREIYVVEYWNPEYPIHWQKGEEYSSLSQADAVARGFKTKRPQSSSRIILKKISTTFIEVKKYGSAT